MGVGVFGKLPARRDFVQYEIDGALMELLDPWLQKAVASSREELGRSWLDIYLLAPIWRFWLGSKITGREVLGALMPSVDGVGRYFPLCIAGSFDHAVGPPEVNDQHDWFAGVEALMLAALSDEGSYEDLQAGVGALPPPAEGSATPPDPATVAGAFEAMRIAHSAEFYGQFSCWWVPSSDATGTAPSVLMRRGLPSPVEYASMIAIDRSEPAATGTGGG